MAGDGRPLPLPPASLATWLPNVAQALDFIHAQGYVHRDVKPANILFDAHGNAYLSDFGVAKALAAGGESARAKSLTGAGMVLGTPHYMAPELILGQPFDGRIDQYALAATVHELLSGWPPIDGPTGPAVLVQQTVQPPPPLDTLVPEIPRTLAAAVLRALAKPPSQRFANCAQFARAALTGLDGPVAVTMTAPATCPPPPRVAPVVAAPAVPVAETMLTAVIDTGSQSVLERIAKRRRPARWALLAGMLLMALFLGGTLFFRDAEPLVVVPTEIPPGAAETPTPPSCHEREDKQAGESATSTEIGKRTDPDVVATNQTKATGPTEEHPRVQTAIDDATITTNDVNAFREIARLKPPDLNSYTE